MQQQHEEQRQSLQQASCTGTRDEQRVQQQRTLWQQQQQQQPQPQQHQQQHHHPDWTWTSPSAQPLTVSSQYYTPADDYQQDPLQLQLQQVQQQHDLALQQQPPGAPQSVIAGPGQQQEWHVGNSNYPLQPQLVYPQQQQQLQQQQLLHQQLQQQQQLLLLQQQQQEEQQVQLMTMLQQQEQRILHREHQLRANDTFSNSAVQEATTGGGGGGGAAAAANDSLHRTKESYAPPQPSRMHWGTQQQQQPQPIEYFTAPAGFPEYSLRGQGPLSSMYTAGAALQQQQQQQRLRRHVIAGHNRPQSATVAAVASMKGNLKGKGRCWGVSRAVVVGCTYTRHQNYNLRGPANDAHLFAHALVQLMRVEPDDVLLLSDALPDTPYRGSRNSSSGRVPRAPQQQTAAAKANSSKSSINSNSTSSKEHLKGLVLHPTVDVSQLEDIQPNPSLPTQPTKQNILIALNWLVKDAVPGDRLFFYFSGHSTQVDNLSAYEGEGYDEALLPVDFDSLGSEEDANLLLTTHVKEVLLSVSPQVHVCMILDTCGCQTILDPAGTGSMWTFIKGVKQKGLWPLLTDPTNRMQRANYNSTVWLDPNMQAQRVRPRYLPCVEISSSNAVRCPVLCSSRPLSGSSKAYLLAAAPWSQVAVEAALPSIELPVRLSQGGPLAFAPHLSASDGGRPVVHGIFTWCLVSVLLELFGPNNASGGRRVSYQGLIDRVRNRVRDLKWNRLFALDQMPELTVHTGGNASFDDLFYSLGWPAAFTPPSSPSAAAAAEGETGGAAGGSSIIDRKLHHTFAAALTATQRLSAACCVQRGDAAAGGAAAAAAAAPEPPKEFMEGYSFLDPAKAWLALTCGGPIFNFRNSSLRSASSNAPFSLSSSSLPASQLVTEGMQQQQQLQQQLQQQQQQPYTAAECFRLVQSREDSADSVASFDTFAPKKPRATASAAAAAGGAPCARWGPLKNEEEMYRDTADCAASRSSGDSPLPPASFKSSKKTGVGFLYTPGSTLLLPPQRGLHSSAAAAAAGQRNGEGGPMGGVGPSEVYLQQQQQQGAASPVEAAATAREAYIVAAAKHIEDRFNVEAAIGAASNAAYQAHLKKVQDVPPQAHALAQLVMQQQQQQLQQQQQQGGGGPQPLNQNTARGPLTSKTRKIPIYDASSPPIYEATRSPD